MGQLACRSIMTSLRKKKDLLLCAATGNSPIDTYTLLADEYGKDPKIFSHLRLVKLDEWGGIPGNDPGTCESFLRKRLVIPLNIDKKRYISFESNPDVPVEECNRIQTLLEKNGPIDLCILGLGMNGHIAFNEPAEELTGHCHVARLSNKSMQHSMTQNMTIIPTFGLTLGMANILQSKKIIILVSGKNKKTIINAFLKRKISTKLPASFLWLHPNVECLLDTGSL